MKCSDGENWVVVLDDSHFSFLEEMAGILDSRDLDQSENLLKRKKRATITRRRYSSSPCSRSSRSRTRTRNRTPNYRTSQANTSSSRRSPTVSWCQKYVCKDSHCDNISRQYQEYMDKYVGCSGELRDAKYEYQVCENDGRYDKQRIGELQRQSDEYYNEMQQIIGVILGQFFFCFQKIKIYFFNYSKKKSPFYNRKRVQHLRTRTTLRKSTLPKRTRVQLSSSNLSKQSK